jgi:membrane-associated phospholipid phosphatase
MARRHVKRAPFRPPPRLEDEPRASQPALTPGSASPRPSGTRPSPPASRPTAGVRAGPRRGAGRLGPLRLARAALHRQLLLRAGALAGAFLYLIAISAYLLTHGGWPTPDYLIPPLLLFAIALGRGWPFVLDWGPFLVLVLSWQATAGLADQLGRPVHVMGPLRAERWLFRGTIPTVWLQDRLFDPTRAHWYDWAATLQHALHFVLPVALGLVLWLRSRRLYWRYLATVLVLFYLGFAGYALYPAAPPWLAGLQGVIPPVHRVAVETLLRLPASTPVGLAYNHMNPNPVAAIPSLHAALPLLLALLVVHLWGRRTLPVLLYPLTMGVNLVYLGEHYVVDVLAGYATAVVAYLVAWVLPARLPLPRPALPLPSLALPRPLRLAADGALPVLAVASVLVIAATLRPSRPAGHPGPVVPGLQVQAGQSGVLDPVPCDQGTSTSLTAGNILLPVTGRYAVFLFDLDEPACYSLSANASFSAPRMRRLTALAARAPVRLAPFPRPGRGVEYYALRIGRPAPALLAAGLPADHRYLLSVGLADVADLEAAARAVDELEALVLIPEPPTPAAEAGEPEPTPLPMRPPPVLSPVPPPPTPDPVAAPPEPAPTLEPADTAGGGEDEE